MRRPNHPSQWNARATSAGCFSCERMRDEVANDNMSAAERQQMMAWAQDKMSNPSFRPFAIRAMFVAQQP